MLYTIIANPRSGSTSAAKEIANELGVHNLNEIMHGYRHNTTSEERIARVIEVLAMSRNKDILIKFHVEDLVMIHEYSVNLLKEVFKRSSKLYYTVRLDYKSQIISQILAQKTNYWGRNRNTDEVVVLEADQIPKYNDKLINMLSIQGEWFKAFPGKLLVLENRESNPYPKFQFKFEEFDYLNRFQDIDVLAIFNEGNSRYTLQP
jgi:LPS sulfotransferase NodH